KTATFSTGLLNKCDWKAKWITHEPPANNQSSLEDASWIYIAGAQPATKAETHVFSKTFTIPADLSEARIHITADDQFTAALNDENFGNSDGRTDAWKRPRAFDLTHLLKTGQNELKITVRNAGGQGALLAKLVIKLKNGQTQV